MTKHTTRLLVSLIGSAGLLAGLAATGVAGAAPVTAGPFGPQTTLYVSGTTPSQPWVKGPHGPQGPQNYGCNNAQYTTISAAVAAATSGARIFVCPGAYSEDVVVTEPLTIIGTNAIVNPGTATNSPIYADFGNNAFTVMAQNVTIEGFTVEGATGDGILSIANYSTIINNTALNNGTGPDGGTGIDLNGSSWSTVSGNTARNNSGGGVYLTDDPGTPASYDTVTNNVTDDNPGGCGVILADHTAAGVFDNKIIGNESIDNGNDPAGSGAGIVLASPVPGGAVYR